MNPGNEETLQMADEINLKPKISCPECREEFPEWKMPSHIERHRPHSPPGPGTSLCPKGCNRNLTRTELKEHTDLCDGSLPLPSNAKAVGPVSTSAPPPEIPKKEEKMTSNGPKKVCRICGITLKSGRALGGHMSKHNRKQKPGTQTAQTAARPSRRPVRRTGRKLATSRRTGPSVSFPRAGDNLPPSPARKADSNSAAGSLREAARQKRSAAQEMLVQAIELEKMAERAEQLL